MRCEICGFFVEEPQTKCPICGGAVNMPAEALQPEMPGQDAPVTETLEQQHSSESGMHYINEPVSLWQETTASDTETQSVRTFVASPEKESASLPEADAFSWDTKDFSAPRRVENIKFVWPESVTKDYPTIFTNSAQNGQIEKAEASSVPGEEPALGISVISEESGTVGDAETLAAKYESAEDLAAKYENTTLGVSDVNASEEEFSEDSDDDILTIEKILSGVTLQEEDSDPEDAMPPVSGTAEEPDSVRIEGLIPESVDTERPMFYTFQTKTDEFQKLLDKEYERIHSMYGDEYDSMNGATIPPFAPEEKVQVKELSDFERMLMEDVPSQTEPTAAQKFFTQDPDQQSLDIDPDEFTASLNDSSRMTIDQIEDTIKALEAEEVLAEAERSERKKRLEAMAAAREEYFKSLDDFDSKGRPRRRQEQKPSAEAVKEKNQATESEKKFASAAVPDLDKTIEIKKDAIDNSEKPTVDLKAALAAAAWLGMDTEKVAASYAAKEDVSEITEPAEVVQSELETSQDVFDTAPASMEEALQRLRDISEQNSLSIRKISDEAEDLAAKYENPAFQAESVEPDTASDFAESSAVEEINELAETLQVEPARKTTYEEEIAQRLAELEALYGEGVEAPAVSQPHPDAIAFYFDKDQEEPAAEPKVVEEPETALWAAESTESTEPKDKIEETTAQSPQYEPLTNVYDIIEERPAKKDPLEVTNETSSLAFLYDDLPSEEVADIIARENADHEPEVDILSDTTWRDLWAQPSEVAEGQTEPEIEAVQEDPADASDISFDELLESAPSEVIEVAETVYENAEETPAIAEEALKADEETHETSAETAENPNRDVIADDSDMKIFRMTRREQTVADIEETEDAEVPEYSEDAVEDTESELDTEPAASNHVVLKIIAVLLVLCAVFEGAVLLLAKLAPDAGITQSLVGIEESVVGGIGNFFGGIFGGSK